MTDKLIQDKMSSDAANPATMMASQAKTSTSANAALDTEDAKTTPHSALFGLTGQSSPTKSASAGPGSSIIGTSSVTGKHNSVSLTNSGGLTGGKTEAEVQKS